MPRHLSCKHGVWYCIGLCPLCWSVCHFVWYFLYSIDHALPHKYRQGEVEAPALPGARLQNPSAFLIHAKLAGHRGCSCPGELNAAALSGNHAPHIPLLTPPLPHPLHHRQAVCLGRWGHRSCPPAKSPPSHCPTKQTPATPSSLYPPFAPLVLVHPLRQKGEEKPNHEHRVSPPYGPSHGRCPPRCRCRRGYLAHWHVRSFRRFHLVARRHLDFRF